MRSYNAANVFRSSRTTSLLWRPRWRDWKCQRRGESLFWSLFKNPITRSVTLFCNVLKTIYSRLRSIRALIFIWMIVCTFSVFSIYYHFTIHYSSHILCGWECDNFGVRAHARRSCRRKTHRRKLIKWPINWQQLSVVGICFYVVEVTSVARCCKHSLDDTFSLKNARDFLFI